MNKEEIKYETRPPLKKIVAAFIAGLLGSISFIAISESIAGDRIGTLGYIPSVIFLFISGLYFGFNLGLAVTSAKYLSVFSLTSGFLVSLPSYIFLKSYLNPKLSSSIGPYALIFLFAFTFMFLLVYGVLEEDKYETAKKALNLLSREAAKFTFFFNFAILYAMPLWNSALQGNFTLETGVMTFFFFILIIAVYLFPFLLQSEKSPVAEAYLSNLRANFKKASLIAIPFSAFFILLFMQILAIALIMETEKNWFVLVFSIIVFAILLYLFSRGETNNE